MRLCKQTGIAATYQHLDDDELRNELRAYMAQDRMNKADKVICNALVQLAQSRGIHFNEYANKGINDASKP